MPILFSSNGQEGNTIRARAVCIVMVRRLFSMAYTFHMRYARVGGHGIMFNVGWAFKEALQDSGEHLFQGVDGQEGRNCTALIKGGSMFISFYYYSNS